MRRSGLLLASAVLAVLLASGVMLVALEGPAQAAFPGKNGQLGGEGEWSPDGTEVVFSASDGNDPPVYRIYVKDVASGATTLLRTPDYCDEESCVHGGWGPTWSPDGTKIAYVNKREWLGGGGDECYYVSVMNADGSDSRILPTTCDEHISDVEWSPDGSQIAFSGWAEFGSEIRVVSANGKTASRTLDPAGWFTAGNPEWSPDGKQLIFSAVILDENWEVTDSAILKVNADGSNKTRLTGTDQTPGFATSWHVWSPDGTKIAYAQNGEIWTMKPDGSAQTDTNTPAPTGTVDWQPLCTIEGTSSNDALTGTSSKDVICGMGGNDQIKGLAGDDVLLGGDGNDTLSGGTGNDRLFGGLGTDTASYQSSATAVRATMIDEGATGEGTDTFMTLDNLIGSAFADELIGSSGANVLRGGKGNDVLRGRGSNDTLAGDAGADQHYGEIGDDTLNSVDGVKGNDTLSGGPDTDTCFKDATERSVAYCEQY